MVKPRSLLSRVPLIALAAFGITLSAVGCSAAAEPTDVTDSSSEELSSVPRDITLSVLSSFKTGNEGAAEISAYDKRSKRLFVVNASGKKIDVLDLSNPAAPSLVGSLPVAGTPNSVAVKNGMLAVASEAVVRTDPGAVDFYNSQTLAHIRTVAVGAIPDMVTFTPDGSKVLTANEGEPSADYAVDPEGSVSIIDVSCGDFTVTTARFTSDIPLLNAASIRHFGPNAANPALDYEPEYITVSEDSRTAWVTLQEANAIATLDLKTGTFKSIKGLGFKDHMLAGNGLDVSDRDNAANIANWPVYGMYQPDAIASFRVKGKTYLITANEGDAREWGTFIEDKRVSELVAAGKIDPASPVVGLASSSKLGRLTVSAYSGDDDGDGDLDRVFVHGSRSFSVWSADVDQVYDSGEEIERRTLAAYPNNFNADQVQPAAADNRSDNKGPEPEGVVVGNVRGRLYAFVGLERIGGVLVYDVTVPTAPRYVTYVNNRNIAAPDNASAGDLGPEGLHFVSADDSPNGRPLLVVTNEISGTVTTFGIGW